MLAYILSYAFRQVERGLKLQNLLSSWLKLMSSTEIGMLSTESCKFDIILKLWSKFKCLDTWETCKSCRNHYVHSCLVLQVFSLCIYSSFSKEKRVTNQYYRILTVKVPASREKSHKMYVTWFGEPPFNSIQCNLLFL